MNSQYNRVTESKFMVVLRNRWRIRETESGFKVNLRNIKLNLDDIKIKIVNKW